MYFRITNRSALKIDWWIITIISSMPRGKPKADLISRFLRRVNKQGKNVSEELGLCWEWQGGKFSTGYGQLKEEEWGERYTHRWSYIYHHKQPIPENMLVRHKCDNRCCVNPEHLELGTKADNVNDMTVRHYKPHNRKFVKEQIEEIRTLREGGAIYKDIAEQFKCSRRTIEKIIVGHTYGN